MDTVTRLAYRLDLPTWAVLALCAAALVAVILLAFAGPAAGVASVDPTPDAVRVAPFRWLTQGTVG